MPQMRLQVLALPRTTVALAQSWPEMATTPCTLVSMAFRSSSDSGRLVPGPLERPP